MRIPVSKGRVDAQAQMQTFTPNTGLAEIGRSIEALEARSENLEKNRIKQKKLILHYSHPRLVLILAL